MPEQAGSVVVPLVHLGGTNGDELARQLTGVADALDSALSALVDAAPNGRDYYPLPDGVFATAVEDHRGRIQRVVALLAEVNTIREALADGRFGVVGRTE